MTKYFKSLFSREKVSSVSTNHLRKGFNTNKRNQIKNQSQYSKMLRESKKVRQFYGNLSKKYFEKLFRKNCNNPSKLNENMFCILESRLDVVLYRAGFFKSIISARQIIRIGRVVVNKKKIISPSHIMIPGDIISIFEKKKTIFKSNKSKISFITHNNSIKKLLLTANTKNYNRFHFTKGQASALLWKAKNLYKNNYPSHQTKFGEHMSKLKKSLFLKSKTSISSSFLKKTSFFQILPLENHKESNFKDLLMPLSLVRADHKAKLCVSSRNTIKTSFQENKLIYNNLLKKNIKWRFKVSPLLISIMIQNKAAMLLSILKKVIQPSERQISFGGVKENEKLKFFSSFMSLFNKNNSKFFETNNNCLSFLSVIEKENFLFLNYLLYIKKHLQKQNNFSKRKDQSLFSGEQKQVQIEHKSKLCEDLHLQRFLKKTKPDHLEVSYKSLSVIFLFPPQRICFPHFINLSLIYK